MKRTSTAVIAAARLREGLHCALWLLCAAMLAGIPLGTGCESPGEPDAEGGDRSAPSVQSTLPVADQVGVPTVDPITVVFNERVNPGTVGPMNFRVTVLGQPVPGAILADGEARSFTYVPEGGLPESRRIEVEVRNVVDVAGNPLASPFLFGFRTAGDEPLPPRVPSNPRPPDGAVAVPIDTVFRWTGGSDTGDPVVYDFWLGRSPSTLSRLATGLDGTEFTPGPLPYSTGHIWQIVARSNGLETDGPLWSFTTAESPDPTNQPPDVPCNPSPEPKANDILVTTEFDWDCTSDPDGDPVTFDVYLGTSTDPGLVATVSDPPYEPVTPLTTMTRYYWRIEARDSFGAVSSSPLWSFDTEDAPPPNDPPSAPAPPISPPDGGTILGIAILLTWSGGEDPDGDPESYLVRFGTTNPPPDLRTVTIKAAFIQNLDNETTYYWQIVARDDHGHATEGPVWHFQTPGAPNDAPSAPCNPDPSNNDDSVPVGTSLDWGCGTDPDGDDVVYVVYFSGGTVATDSVATTDNREYSPPAPLAYSESYAWRIEARDDRGGVTSSPTWRFTTVAQNQPPTVPCNPDPGQGEKDIEPDGLRLRWGCGQDPDDGDEETYDVYFGLTPDPQLIDSVDERNYRVGGVDKFTTYYWKIVARDDRGGVTEGPVWHFTTGKEDDIIP
jgi:Bacterial Ig-like domain